MTLAILCLLCAKLPDFFVRALLWLRSLGRYRLKVIGMNNLPSNGPVILATNCDRYEACLQVLSATDRFTRFVLLESPGSKLPPLLGYLVRRTSLAVLPHGNASEEVWAKALRRAVNILKRGEMVGLPADSNGAAPDLDRFLRQLHEEQSAVVLPVFCGESGEGIGPRQVQVVIGQPLPPGLPVEYIRREIHRLEYWVDHVEHEAAAEATTLMIPVASSASPTGPAAGRPENPSRE